MGLVERDENLREQAMQRWRVLRPHVEDGVALSAAAEAAGVPLRTAQRWLERYRADGLAGLARRGRGDRGVRRLPCELVELVEGLALRRPRPSVAFIHRQVLAAAARAGWPAPSYSTVYGIVRHLDPGLLTLAAYVGEPVTIRYDPRDLGEVRVFHHDRFLCRAIAPELADQTIGLRELQAARTAQRRALRAQLRQRRSVADALCPPPSSAGFEPREASPPAVASTPSPPRLRRYREE